MRKICTYLILILACSQAAPVLAEELSLSKGQLLYLPIYSSILYGDSLKSGPLKFNLSALVSIRNTSLKTPIKIMYARYYDTHGKLLKDFVSSAQTIAPMATLELFIEKSEAEGGSGANFLIEWSAESATNAPIVEAVHIGNQSNRPYSFVTRAQAVHKDK
jgi:hypothetical protein